MLVEPVYLPSVLTPTILAELAALALAWLLVAGLRAASMLLLAGRMGWLH